MSDDPLDIPPFLRRDPNERPPPPKRQPATQRKWIMPPTALGAVVRAVRAGADTMQKIRKRTKHQYKDREISQALHALIRSGDISRDGRRYLPNRRSAKP